jgi:hypothetical protein
MKAMARDRLVARDWAKRPDVSASYQAREGSSAGGRRREGACDEAERHADYDHHHEARQGADDGAHQRAQCQRQNRTVLGLV